jgi:hypothetical protein
MTMLLAGPPATPMPARGVRRLPASVTRAGVFGALIGVLLAPSLAAGQRAEALRGPYFGQPSPGRVPALFAPERFADPGEYHSPPVFSPDGAEAWWTPMPGHGRPTTLMARLVDGAWTEQAYEDFGLEACSAKILTARVFWTF